MKFISERAIFFHFFKWDGSTVPYRIQKIMEVKTDAFKKKFDEELRNILDTHKIVDYGASVGAETNSIVDQKNRRKEDMVMSVRATLTVR